MCEDFAKSLKENIFTIILCIINVFFGSVSYAFTNDLQKAGLVTLVEKIVIVFVTIFAIFKDHCSCKKKEQKIIAKGNQFVETLSNSLNLIGELKKLKANRIRDAEILINIIRIQTQKIIDNL